MPLGLLLFKAFVTMQTLMVLPTCEHMIIEKDEKDEASLQGV